MDKLTPIELEDGTIIYIEATQDVDTSNVTSKNDEEEEVGRRTRGMGRSVSDSQAQALQNFKAIEGTIRTYTTYTLNAFKQVTTANITKVTLEFGLKVGGSVGVPYITQGTAESNLKITVECEFAKSTKVTSSIE